MRTVQTDIEEKLYTRIARAAKDADRSLAAELRRALKSVYEATGETRKVDNG